LETDQRAWGAGFTHGSTVGSASFQALAAALEVGGVRYLVAGGLADIEQLRARKDNDANG
jgi:hypothetical protein